MLRPKIKFYLFPLTRPTLKKGPYPKYFISIFSLELFFKIHWQFANLKIIFKKYLSCKLFVYLMLLPKEGLFTIKFNGYRVWEVK